MTIHTRDTELRHNILVASYDQYENAEKAVNLMSDYGFPARKMSIVGRGLERDEQVAGRPTNTSAGLGVASGAVAGAGTGGLFAGFDWAAPLISEILLILCSSVVGALVGAAVGWFARLGTGGRPDTPSEPSFRARSYDLFVDAEYADQVTAALRATTEHERAT